MAELSDKDVCAPVEDLRTGVRRLSLPQWLLASHCTPNSRFVPSFPVEGQKSTGSACLLPAAPVLRASSHQSEMLLLGKTAASHGDPAFGSSSVSLTSPLSTWIS